MLKLAKNAVIWEQEYGFREYSGEEKNEYLGMCHLRVYIGGLWSSSRSSTINGTLCSDS